MQKSGTNEPEVRRRNNGNLGNTGREVGGDKCMVPFCPISAVHLTAIFARFEHGNRRWNPVLISRLCPLSLPSVVLRFSREWFTWRNEYEAWSLVLTLFEDIFVFDLNCHLLLLVTGTRVDTFKPWDEYECSPYWNPDISFYKSGEFVRSGHSIFGDQLVYFHEVCARSSSSSAWKITYWSRPSLGSGSPVRVHIPKQQLVINPNLKRPVQLK